MKLGELFVKLGVDADNAAVEKFNNGLKSTAKTALGLKAAFAAAIYGMDRFVQGTVQTYANLQNINEQTGLSIELLQKWDKASQLANLSVGAGQAAGAIQNLQEQLAELRLSGGGSGAFTLLGIDVGNLDAFGVLDKLRNRIQAYTPDVASNLLKKIGLDPSLISVLKLSREEFEKLGRNDFLTQKGRNALIKTAKALKEIKMRFQALKDQVALQLSPVLLKLLNGFFKWIVSNRSAIVNAITSIARVFGDVAIAAGNAFGVVGDFIKSIFGLSQSVGAIKVAFGVLFLFLSKRMKIFTLIIGFLDEIAAWRAGGESMFKPMFDWVSKVYDLVKDLISESEYLSEVFDKIGQYLKSTLTGAAIGSIIPGVGTAAGAFLGASYGYAKDQGVFDFALGKIQSPSRSNSTTITNNNSYNLDIKASGEPRENAQIIMRELQNAKMATGNGVR